jgi:hypothetical protein
MAQGRKRRINSAALVPQDKLTGKPQFFGETLASFSSESELMSLASIDQPNRLMTNNRGNYPAFERYEQIYKGVMPFNSTTYGSSNFLDCQQFVELCQKAYFNVSAFRNTIDIMTEFSNSEVFFKGGPVKARKFFENWFNNKVGGYSLLDQFFREWYRSGNVFLYRIDADVSIEILKQFGTVYGAAPDKKSGLKMPIKYLFINPAYIRCESSLNFLDNVYYKLLTNYELQRIKNPKTEEEEEFAKSINLDKNGKKNLKTGSQILFPLEPKKVYVVFCKKQDYEPFAVPLFFPVLEDIDLKLQFKRIEKALARTVEYVTLLIKVGTEENPNPAALDAMQELYRNETIGRVLVAPGGTEMDFIIPDLNKVLGPEKYKQVNEDISQGLMNIFSSDEKFSSTSIKIKVFMERLKESRKAFLENFLNPEIKRISQELGFQSYPKAYMADIDLNDKNLADKITIQLGQLGILTAEEVLERIQNGYTPTPEENIESQKEYKKLRDEGLYLPLLGGNNQGDEGGRPEGKGTKQTTKNVSPVGTSKASFNDYKFNIEKVAETFVKTNSIYASLEKEAKKQFKVKNLNDKQKEVLNNLVPLILVNEQEENWITSAKEYIQKPKPIKSEVGLEIDEIMSQFDSSLLLSCILYKSKK